MEGRYKWKDHYNKLHDVNFAYEGICPSFVVSDKKNKKQNPKTNPWNNQISNWILQQGSD